MWVVLITILFSVSAFAGDMIDSDRWFPFESNGLWGYKNKRGEIVVPAVYDSIYSELGFFFDALVKRDGKYGMIAPGGAMRIECECDTLANIFPNGVACKKDSLWYFCSTSPDNADIPFGFDSVRFGEHNHGVYAIKRADKWGLACIDVDFMTGLDLYRASYYLPPLYDEIGHFSRGPFNEKMLFPVKERGLWGFIRPDGTYGIHPQFEEVKGFHYLNVAAVKKDGRWGFIRKNGTMSIPCKYDSVAGYGYEGYHAWVWKDGEQLKLDKTGMVVERIKQQR